LERLQEAQIMTRICLAVGSVALVGSIMSAAVALAHEAATGWAYAPECCSNRDCHQIEETDVSVVPGGWRIKATGEVFSATSVRHSPDGRFHRCSAYGRLDSHTYCLYVPDFGS
jgi:hypothetical protein